MCRLELPGLLLARTAQAVGQQIIQQGSRGIARVGRHGSGKPQAPSRPVYQPRCMGLPLAIRQHNPMHLPIQTNGFNLLSLGKLGQGCPDPPTVTVPARFRLNLTGATLPGNRPYSHTAFGPGGSAPIP